MRITGRPPRVPRRGFSALTRLAAVIAGPGVVLAAVLGAPARAGVPANPAWETQAPQGAWRNDGYTVVSNVQNQQAWSPTTWAFSYRHWGIETTLPATLPVPAYPSVQRAYAVRYGKMRRLQSSFTESIPQDPAISADAAYTMWLTDPANRQVKVVMRVDQRNAPSPGGSHIGTPFFYQQHFNVYQSASGTFTFVLAGQPEPQGRVHLLSALRWLATQGHIGKSDLLNELDFGWEITSTGSQPADFQVTRYAVDFVRKRSAATPVASASSGLSVSAWIFAAGLAAVFAALVAGLLLLFGRFSRASQNRILTGMFERYGPAREPTPATVPEVAQGRVATAAVGAMQRAMTTTTQERLAKRLDLAGSARKPAEWALLGVCVGVGLAAALSFVTSYVFIGVVAGAVVGWLTMRLSLSLRILRRRAAFSDQLPDLLQLIASTLRAGFSLPQALDAVVKEAAQPAAAEFARAMTEARIGAELDEALEAVAIRMDSDDLQWTVLAIRIQQGVGGNLAEVLLTIAGTIRERAFLRRQVQALSAEGRLSAYVLIALPVLVGAFLFIVNGSYMRPLYSTTIGFLMLSAAVTLLLVGAYWMNRTIKVEV